MPTERSVRVRDEAGFTLIEVVAAMIILAVGLLALEALGIGVARSVARAERQSEHATLASDSLESALHQLRAGVTPTQFCTTIPPHSDQLSRRVSLSANQAVVTVRVSPNSQSGSAPAKALELASSVFLPAALTGAVNGTPCS